MKKSYLFFSIVLFLLILSTTAFSQGFRPPHISGLQLWLKADSLVTLNGSTVSGWGDCTGAYSCSQATSANQPTKVNSVAQLNGMPAIYFDGTNDVLNGTLINGIETSSMTVFIVATGENVVASGYYAIFAISATSNGFWVSRYNNTSALRVSNNNGSVTSLTNSFPSTGFDPKIISVVKNFGGSGPVQIFLNGTQSGPNGTTSTLAGIFTNAAYKVGYGGSNNYYKGNIAEIIIYFSALTTIDRQKVETYLSNKYAPPVTLGPDINMAPKLCDTILDAESRFFNYNWSTGDTTRTITVNRTGTYSVAATNIFGIVSRDTINVIYPNCNLNTLSTIICPGDSIALKPQTGNLGSYTLEWSPGGSHDSVFYAKLPGKYSVKVTDSYNCFKYSDTATVTIDSLRSHFTLGPDTIMCASGIIQPIFPGYTMQSYMWKGGSSADSLAIYSTDTYWVTGTDNHNCTATDSILVTISGAIPATQFIADTVCYGDSTQFTDLSTVSMGSVTSWIWSFGDGDTSTLQHPVHLFASPGVYNVSLTATSGGSCQQTIIKPVIVHALPIAGFSLTQGCINNPYQFSDGSTAAPGDSIIGWLWYFGDGDSSLIRNPLHTYLNAGNYNIELQINTRNGCVNSLTTQMNVVSVAPPLSPFTLISPLPNFIFSSSSVNISWQNSMNAVSYTVQFAEDSLFTNNLHTYPGINGTNYTATLALNKTWFCRVYAFDVCGGTQVSDTRKFRTYTPASIPGMSLWLKADSNVSLSGSNVNSWADCSGNTHLAIQTVSGNRPLLIDSVPLLNGMPALSFDGINDILTGDTIQGLNNSSITMFIVASGNSQTINGYYTLFAINTSLNGFWYVRSTFYQCTRLSNNSSNLNGTFGLLPNSGYNPKIFGLVKTFGTGPATVYINGVPDISGSASLLTGSFTNGVFKIGSSGTANYYNGNIAEVLIFNNALSQYDRTSVEAYLNYKYAPPVNLGPDIVKTDFCPVIIDAGPRFTNLQWSTGDTTQTITVSQSGTYSVAATNVFGTLSYDTITVSYPSRHLNITSATVCMDDSISLRPLTGNISNYSLTWHPVASTDSMIYVKTSGQYWVTIVDSLGACPVNSDTATIVVDSLKHYFTIGNDTSMCAGYVLKPKHPGYNSLGFLWMDNSTDSTITVWTSGNYSVNATDNNGCLAHDSVNVTITGWAPVVRFIADSICLGTTTSFTDSSTVITPPPSTIISWAWDFGDGDTSVVQSPGHVYATSGVYQASLTVLTNVGCQHTITNPVTVYQPPTAIFSPTTACTLTPYQFIDGSTAAPGDSIVSWLWHFGDGFSASIKDPSHQYTVPGTYYPDLTVTTVNGCSSTYNSNITVVSSSLPPTPFSLLAPLHNFMFSTASINFSWTVSTNADHYTLYVAEDSNFNLNLQTINNIISTSYTGTFMQNKTYWWKVIAQDVCGGTFAPAARKFRIFNPAGVPGMKLWLKADAGITTEVGGVVSRWEDQSGNNNDALQALSANRPLFKTSVDSLNGKPALYFNGSTKFLSGTTIPLIDSSSITLFIVASGNSTTPGSYSGLFSINTSTAGFALARVISSSNCLRVINKNQTLSSSNNSLPAGGYYPKILSVVKTYGARTDLYINGGLDGTSTNSTLSGPFTNGDYKVGCIATGSYYKGNVAEIILFNSALSTANRKNIETYFRYKYAPPVNLGPDINIAYSLCDTLLNAGPRFTSYLWSTGETTSSITAGSGTYWVSVTDIFGYPSTDTIKVTKPYLHVGDTAFCLFSSAIISSGFTSGYSTLWADSSTSPVYTADSAGTFWVKVSDTLGCFAVDTFVVVVDSFAVQATLGPDRNLCQGNTIGLVYGAQQATTYLWNDGTGNSLYAINDLPGSNPAYSVTVTDNFGCTATDTVNIHISGVAPIPLFSADSVCLGLPSHFTDLSSVIAPYSLTGWQWDFGDSTTSINQSPNHTFAGYGIYYSTLTVTTDSGCVNAITKPVFVYSLPDVHFQPLNGCSGVPVPFADHSTDAFGGITSWLWNFGDPASGTANTSILENPLHTYALQGSYPVTLIASSVAGCADTITSTINIKESPAIDFSWIQSCEGTPVFFTNLTTTPPWAQITDMKWDFGDGDSSVYDNPAHNYSSAGTYNVTLTVRALSGCQISLTKQVIVHAIPQADFTAGLFCEGSAGFFTDASTIGNDSITQWHWDFDSLGNSNLKNPYFVFPDTGTFHVNLTVTSNAGCSSSTMQTVSVYPKPIASFTFDPAYGVPPLAVSFTNASIGATSYFWDFGDGGTDLSNSPSHTYSSEGIYTVLLIANNANNCPDSAAAVIYVIPTKLDIAVLSVSADNSGNYLKFSTNIKNLGTRGVDEVDLSAQLNKGSIIKETWTGNLMPGDVATYYFNAQFMIPPGGAADYICINATVPGTQPDNQPSNNEQCLVLQDIFIVSEPYPDPVVNQVNIDVIIPFAEQLDIELYNENGQKIGIAFSGQANEGYNNFIIPTDFLNQGAYAIKVAFRDKIEVRKFIKF